MLRSTSSTRRLGELPPSATLLRYGNDEDLAALMAAWRPDVIVHNACSYGRDGESPLNLVNANVQLGLLLLECLQARTGSTLFLNTGSVLAPDVSNYALSKHQFTQWGRQLTARSGNGVRFVNIRLQHMYGPGDDRSKFVTHVLHACHRNQPRLDLTLGEQQRDFIYIDDVVRAYDCLLENQVRLTSLSDLDVGSGVAPTVRHLVQTAHRLLSSRTVLNFGALPYRDAEPMHCRADTAALQSMGWTAQISLEQGLQSTIEKEFGTCVC